MLSKLIAQKVGNAIFFLGQNDIMKIISIRLLSKQFNEENINMSKIKSLSRWTLICDDIINPHYDTLKFLNTLWGIINLTLLENLWTFFGSNNTEDEKSESWADLDGESESWNGKWRTH